MMRALKFSIIFMTMAIFVLAGLIIYKLFFAPPQETHITKESPKPAIITESPLPASAHSILVLPIPFEKSKIVDFSITDEHIAIMNRAHDITVFDRNSGAVVQGYSFKSLKGGTQND